VRVAALYDVHGNLPALDTVPAELEEVLPDVVLVGGDVLGGALSGGDRRAPARAR